MNTIEQFWSRARALHREFPEEVPEAWAFGATPEHADELLALVLQGVKTGTASTLWEYDESNDPLPRVGEYSIILDGTGTPRAVIETTGIDIVPFIEVTAEHAAAEGEGDRTLAHWRESHERYWRRYSESPRDFTAYMPIVCERFELRFD